MTPQQNVAALRIAKRLPKGGESLISTAARALLNPVTHRPSHIVDNQGTLVQQRVYEDFSATDTADQVTVLSGSYAAGGARVVTTNVANLIYTPGKNILCAWNIVQQDIAPSIVAAGLDIGCDQTSGDGMEVCTHAHGATGRPFVVGSDPAFYFKATITPSDVSGLTHLVVGFRRLQAAAVTVATYVDYATIGLVAGDITIKSSTAGSSNSTDISTDTTDNLADAATAIFEVLVSNTGVVTYKVNGVAPTTTAAYTFPDGTMVIPFIQYIHGADVCDTLVIGKYDVGYQGS